MGSVPSIPDDDRENDRWWPIEQENFELDQTPLLPSNMEQQQGYTNAEDQNNCATSSNSSDQAKDNNSSEKVIESNDELSENYADNESKSDQLEENANSSISDQSKEQTIDEFEVELKIKRQQRFNAVSVLRNELLSLRSQLAEQKEINAQLKYELNEKQNLNKDTTNNDVQNTSISNEIKLRNASDDNDVKEDIEDEDDIGADLREIRRCNNRSADIALKSELSKIQLQLQLANSEILSLTAELNATRKQVGILKDVVKVTKDMVAIRDEHLKELKVKLKEIEDSLATRELKIMSENLRQEYDRQLINIRNLRTLYEERARVNAAERENLIRQLDTKRTEFDAEVEKNRILAERVEDLEKDLQNKTNDLYNTKDDLIRYKLDNKDLQEEMTVINELFSQLLMGFNSGNDIDIDKLTNMLEDNRELLHDIANRECTKDGAAALPKLLFDLVTQSKEEKDDVLAIVDDEALISNTNQSIIQPNITSAKEIVNNLPKVWKVLIELLNHQKAIQVDFKENGQSEECYKSVQTPSGPQLVLSVSKTYIRLKDLILEKKFLQKETQKLKSLNNHLESRLSQQESRLSTVSIELNKTWSLVGRMQRQHRQLHTNEQVLRYQLQQKRRMLNELKDELEYCRRKWALARAKNDESQTQWNSLRLEFSKRKEQDNSNSAESGYSDDHLSDEENSDEDTMHMKNIRSLKKELTDSNLGVKSIRTQSVSPIRNINSDFTHMRRNSAPPIITQEFHTTGQIVGISTDPQNIDSENSENSDAASSSIKPIVSEKHDSQETQVDLACSMSNVLIQMESKKTGTRPKLSREIQKKTNKCEKKNESDESLEDMFFRISGQPRPISEQKEETEENENLSDDERRARRTERFQRLEQQCQQLISKVIKSSAKGDKLNIQLDEMQNKILTDNIATEVSQAYCDQQQSIETESNLNELQTKNDLDFLTTEEREYTARRAARLQRLEEECQAFLHRANERKNTAIEMNKKVDELHERFGSENDSSAEVIMEPFTSTSNTSEKLDNIAASCIDVCDEQSNDNAEPTIKLKETEEAYMQRRADRLQRLEVESAEFLRQMAQSASRVSNIENHLDELHERYGNSIENTESSSHVIAETIDGLAINDPELNSDIPEISINVNNTDNEAALVTHTNDEQEEPTE